MTQETGYGFSRTTSGMPTLIPQPRTGRYPGRSTANGIKSCGRRIVDEYLL